jgi:hypothetical protein
MQRNPLHRRQKAKGKRQKAKGKRISGGARSFISLKDREPFHVSRLPFADCRLPIADCRILYRKFAIHSPLTIHRSP